jgi:hypothetical protein
VFLCSQSVCSLSVFIGFTKAKSVTSCIHEQIALSLSRFKYTKYTPRLTVNLWPIMMFWEIGLRAVAVWSVSFFGLHWEICATLQLVQCFLGWGLENL